MKGKIIYGSNDKVGIVISEFRLHEIPNNIRKAFSEYDDKCVQARNRKIFWSAIQEPKEFKICSWKVINLMQFLVKAGSTSKRRKIHGFMKYW